MSRSSSESDGAECQTELLVASLEHCTKWVEFRTSHQAQAVNTYSVVTGFLAAGYFATASAHLRSLAIAVAIAGLIASLGFAYAVLHFSRYVDAGEDALSVIEGRIGMAINMPVLNMVATAKGRRRRTSRKLPASIAYGILIAAWIAAGVLAATQA